MLAASAKSEPTREILEEIACPLCGAPSFDPFLRGRDRLFARGGRYHLVRCRQCTLIFQNPRPTPTSLALHYPDAYFCYLPLEDMRSPKRWIAAAALCELTGRAIRLLERCTGRLTPDAQVLDVGCGINHLLRELRRRRGCTGVGVDFKAEVVAYVRDRLQMPVVHGTLPDARFDAGRFDVVFMTEYLEHEPQPLAILREARRVLRPGGHLAIEVPYIGGWPARIFRSCWSQLDLPRHLVFYTPHTLDDALRRTGFRVLQVRRYGAAFSTGASLMNLLGYRWMGRLRTVELLAVAALGLPSLPFTPLLHEFLHVVARAE